METKQDTVQIRALNYWAPVFSQYITFDDISLMSWHISEIMIKYGNQNYFWLTLGKSFGINTKREMLLGMAPLVLMSLSGVEVSSLFFLTSSRTVIRKVIMICY